jgi:hypothetical protein
MAPLLAACGEHLAAALCLHANAETVRLSPAAFARLICALWQSNSPLIPAKIIPKKIAGGAAESPCYRWFRRKQTQTASAAV